MLPQPPAEVLTTEEAPRDLITAAKTGDVQLCQNLVEDGAPLDFTDADGNTALHWAALKMHLDVVKYLTSQNAPIEIQNHSEGHTPLHWACISGDMYILHHLVKMGANFLKPDYRGYTGLFHAVQYGHLLPVHYLIQKGVPIDSVDAQGHTPLHWACYRGHDQVLLYLLRNGADIHRVDNIGFTAVHWAVAQDRETLIKILQHYGAALNNKSKDGQTPLNLAIDKTAHNAAKYLKNPELSRAAMRKYFWLWYLIPAIFIPGAFILFSTIPFWAAALLLYVVFCLVKYWGGKYYPGHNEKNPFYVSFFFSSFVYSALVYFTQMITVIGSPLLHCVFILCNFAFFYLYLYMLGSDPGVIKRSAFDDQYFLSAVENNLPLPHLCATCMIRKPLRSKHCGVCDVCISRFDHHCQWLNNCVGAKNHKHFLILIALIVSLHIMFCYMCYKYVMLQPGVELVGVTGSIWSMFHFCPVQFSLGVFHFLNMLWESVILFQQLQFISLNITTNDAMNAHRYPYMTQRGHHWVSDFDKGSRIVNLKEFWTESPKKWYSEFEYPARRHAAVSV